MADLVLSVDVTSLADARRKLDGFQKAMNNLSVNRLASGIDSVQNSIRQLVEAQARGTIGQTAYQRGLLELKRAYEQMGYSSQQATAAVRAYAAQLQRQRAAQEAARAAEELARAQAQAAARTRELRLRFQEGYAAFDRARQQMRDLREALRQGIITTDQYREAVRRLREEQQRAAAGAGDLARRMNRAGVITQQAGYQIGDFLVQVQSGTNFLVAFGQQATQVAGTLTLLGGKWILIGSVLGVTIPLVTAIGAAFMRTRGSGQTLDQVVTKLKESFSELSENMGLIGDADLDLRFGNLTAEIRSLASAMVELNAASELGNLTSVLENLEGQATAGFGRQMLQGLISLGTLGMNIKTPEQVNEEFFARLGLPMGRQDFLGQVTSMQEAAGAGDREGVVRIFEAMVEQINQAQGGMAAVSSEGRAVVAQMYQASLATAETNAMLNGSAQAAKEAREQAELETRIREAQNEILRERVALFTEAQQSGNEILNNLMSENALNETIVRFGENSAQVEARRAIQAREAFEARLDEASITGELRDRILEAYAANVRLTEEAKKTSSALDSVAGMDLPITAKVRALADMLGIAADEALRLLTNLPVGTTYGARLTEQGLSVGQMLFGGMEGDIPKSRERDTAGGAREGIGGLAQSLLTEMEQIEMFRTDALAELENFNAMELEILGGHAEARLRIEEEYLNKLRQLEQSQQSQRLGDVAGFFGAMAGVAQAGGDKMVRVASTFSAAQALINSYTAYTEMLKDPSFIGRPFARFAAAASVLGAGLKMVSAIRGVGGGGGGGMGAPGAVDPISSSSSASPQRVVIEGIDRDTLISGEQLSRLFDRLYEENNERGLVFSVAR
jgi:hypothetical protein